MYKISYQNCQATGPIQQSAQDTPGLNFLGNKRIKNVDYVAIEHEFWSKCV